MKTELPNRQGHRAAMTLVEVLIAVGVGSIVMAAVGMLMIYTAKSFVALGNYNDLDQASRNALDVLSRDIRQTKSLKLYSTNQLTFVDHDGVDLQYIWNPGDRTLSRIKGGQSKVLLTECDDLRFGISRRNPSNDFNFFPANGFALAKLVDVSWTCSRQILQKKVNTESVQTAKIVIRN